MDKKRFIIIICIILLFIIMILGSYIYYKDKYEIVFETGNDEIILNQYVSYNSKVIEPAKPNKRGYVFVEWQLNGEKYDFNSKVTSNLVLCAKWAKEEYITIKFNTQSEYKINNIEILKGTNIDKLEELIYEGYIFDGWYLGDKLYENEPLFDDTELVAHYTKIEKFKIGDKVTIIGNYSNSSTSTIAPNKKAIGWKRYILDIKEGSNYPYMIGNKNGVTGFFKEESIKGEE